MEERELEAQLRRAEQEAAGAAAALEQQRAEELAEQGRMGAARTWLKPHERAAESAVSLRFLLAFHAEARPPRGALLLRCLSLVCRRHRVGRRAQ